MKICILSDNIPGHFNQSFGMMHLLFGRSHSNFSVIYVTPRIHFLRSITRFLCRLLSKNISKTKANFILWTYSINLLGLKSNIYCNIYNLLDVQNEFSVWNDTGRSTYTLFAKDVSLTDPGRIGHLNEHLLRPDWYGEPRRINVGINLSL